MSIPGSSTSVNQYPETMTLTSSDKKEFVLSESAYKLSGNIKKIFDKGITENTVALPSIDGKTLSKITDFLTRHGNGFHSDSDKKAFSDQFFVNVDIQHIFEIFLAANYLEAEDLVDLTGRKIADVFKDKSVKWVRRELGIVNDFAPEEENKIKEDNAWAWEGVEEDEDDEKIKKDGSY